MAEIKRDYAKMIDIFSSTAAETQTTTSSKEYLVSELSVSLLQDFPSHPFAFYTGEKFDDLVDSIKIHGVLNPLLVRKLDNGTYQILSGHNRRRAAKNAGFRAVPCIVLDHLTDDDALMIVLDSNTKQRGITEMKISEQAHIYALDVEVNKRQGHRSDLIKDIELNLQILSNDAGSETSSQIGKKLTTLDIVGAKYGISRNTIARLLRIDTLIFKLKTRVDDEEFAINAGVELSYLSDIEQQIVDEVLTKFEYKIDIKKARQLRELSRKKTLNDVTVVEVLEGKYGKKKKVPAMKALTLTPKFLEKFYSTDTPRVTMMEEIEASMDVWASLKEKYPELSLDARRKKLKDMLKNMG